MNAGINQSSIRSQRKTQKIKKQLKIGKRRRKKNNEKLHFLIKFSCLVFWTSINSSNIFQVLLLFGFSCVFTFLLVLRSGKDSVTFQKFQLNIFQYEDDDRGQGRIANWVHRPSLNPHLWPTLYCILYIPSLFPFNQNQCNVRAIFSGQVDHFNTLFKFLKLQLDEGFL